ncbi:hypothetical protein F441_06325 [Phytophthora nicotianae CJ01A1]|uniref:Uncharacterized protein n=1 Tax=Phytophthora nicotianae CJ01A1 TaxID=1317063 RepID=W2XAD5_PHYNI|nr:hypothetical protein F441_06325 [Phytophthora nicotianae CJ01A1]
MQRTEERMRGIRRAQRQRGTDEAGQRTHRQRVAALDLELERGLELEARVGFASATKCKVLVVLVVLRVKWKLN